MLLLASTSDLLRVVTSGAVTTDVQTSWVDMAGAVITPGRANTAISSATTTTIVGSPGNATYRAVKSVAVRNRHASSAQTVTIQHTDGTTAVELIRVVLSAGDQLLYTAERGFWVLDSQGRERTNTSVNGSAAATNALNLVVLASDVTNSNAVANTAQDVTGLGFSVTAGETYFFRATIQYTAAATTTGSRWSINGPASPTSLRYASTYALTTTSQTTNFGLTAYDQPAASNASSAATGANTAWIEGLIRPSADGVVVVRFASEVLSSAIVALAGSTLEWIRVL